MAEPWKKPPRDIVDLITQANPDFVPYVPKEGEEVIRLSSYDKKKVTLLVKTSEYTYKICGVEYL